MGRIYNYLKQEQHFRFVKYIITKIILIIYCLAIVFVCIFVPWKAEIRGSYYSQGVTISLNYSFIWSPPAKGLGIVDFQRVVLEIIGITALLGLAFVLARGLKK